MTHSVRIGLGLCLLTLANCTSGPEPQTSAPAPIPAAPKPAPAAAPATAEYHDHGISFNYPAHWKPGPAQSAVFRVVSPGPAPADLQLDVPSVPKLFAGIVNPTLVGSHYAADVKQHDIPDATVTYADVSAGGGTGRDIKLVGHYTDGRGAINEAIALVHNGQVYIFSCNTNDAGYPLAKSTLDAAVASVHWGS